MRTRMMRVMAAILSMCALACTAAAGRPPNLVYVLADDLGVGELEVYGQTRIKTPYVSRFAAEGRVFTHAYSGAPICTPSRTTFLTGRTLGASALKTNAQSPCGSNAGVRVFGTYTNPRNMTMCDPPVRFETGQGTIAWQLRRGGYRTGHFGKWMIGELGGQSTPQHAGFEYSWGTLDGANGWNYYPPFEFEHNASGSGREASEHVMRPLPGNDDQDNPGGFPWLCLGQFNRSGHPCTFSEDVYVTRAAEFIRRAAADEVPFFAFVAFHLPHADDQPQGSRWDWKNRSATGYGEPIASDAPYSSEPWPQVERNHAARITHLDALFQQLMAVIEAVGQDNNTLTIFTSDNGAHNEGGHSYQFFNSSAGLRGAKGCTWEGGFREPMIVRWPNHVPANTSSAYPWAAYDVLPTFLDAAGLLPSMPASIGVQGQSVLPAFLGQHANGNGNKKSSNGVVRDGATSDATADDDGRLLYWRYSIPGSCRGATCPDPQHPNQRVPCSSGTADYNRPADPASRPTCCDFAFAARKNGLKVRWWSDPSVPPQLYDLTSDYAEANDIAAGHEATVKAIIAEAQQLYDVEDPFWPSKPCTVGNKKPLRGSCPISG